ncbi:MAG: hypothetical protein ACRES5_29705, partial [Pseudomonas sp.]
MSQQVNLYSPIFLKQEKHFSALAMLQALGLILAGCVIFTVYAWYQVGELKERTQDSAKKLASEEARLAKFSSQLSPQGAAATEAEIKKLEAQLQSRLDVSVALRNEVGGVSQGYSAYMRAFA